MLMGVKRETRGWGSRDWDIWKILVGVSLESSLYKPGTPTCVRGAPRTVGSALRRASKKSTFSTRHKKRYKQFIQLAKARRAQSLSETV